MGRKLKVFLFWLAIGLLAAVVHHAVKEYNFIRALLFD